MIDTICLKINLASLAVANAKIKEEMLCSSLVCIGSNWHRWNKPAADKPKGYFPHIEVLHYKDYAQRDTFELRIKVSVPKLLFGNNLFEVQDKDFNSVCSKLQKVLKTMGVNVNLADIEEATVSEVHIGMNVFTKGITPKAFLDRLAAAPTFHKQMDVQRTAFRNGSELTFHNKALQLCLYDKYRELLTNMPTNKSLISKLKIHRLEDILRIELRLKKNSLKQAFKGRIPSFKDLFNYTKLHSLLCSEWGLLYNQYKQVPFNEFSPEFLFYIYAARKRSEIRTLALIALKILQSSLGYKATAERLKSKEAKALFTTLKKIKLPVIPANYNLIAILNQAIVKNEIITPVSLTKKRGRFIDNAPLVFDRLLDVKEAAKYIKVKERTMQKILKEKRCSHFKIGKFYRLSWADVAEYLAQKRVCRKHI